jgi:hypothetical protein
VQTVLTPFFRKKTYGINISEALSTDNYCLVFRMSESRFSTRKPIILIGFFVGFLSPQTTPLNKNYHFQNVLLAIVINLTIYNPFSWEYIFKQGPTIIYHHICISLRIIEFSDFVHRPVFEKLENNVSETGSVSVLRRELKILCWVP